MSVTSERRRLSLWAGMLSAALLLFLGISAGVFYTARHPVASGFGNAAVILALLLLLTLGTLVTRSMTRRHPTPAISEREERFRQIVEWSPAVIYVKDLESRYQLVNRAWEETTGVSREAALGRRTSEILPPAEAARMAATEAAVVATLTACEDERTLQTARGRRNFIAIYFPLLGADGELDAIGGTATDITSVKRAQAELAAVIASTPDALARFDRDLRVLLVNPAIEQICGRGPEEWLGSSLGDVLRWHSDPPPAAWAEARVRWLAEVEACFRTGERRQFEVPALGRGGDEPERDLEVRLIPELDGESVSTALALARDITDRRRAAEAQSLLRAQLDQAERLSGLGHLAANVSHEFNNVLMGISPFTELIRRQNPGNLALQKATEQISNSIARGRHITQEVLRFARPAEPALAVMHVNDWLPGLYRSVTKLIGNVKLEATVSDEPLFITADRAHLEQALTNLILNARDAVGENGTISVTVRRPINDETFPFGRIPRAERYIQFTVADNGAGLAPHELTRIFEPLYSTKKSGMGLGLAVAHQVVARHGGYIFAASQPGEGTQFHVFIPAAEINAFAARHTDARRGIGIRRVLLIEDDAPVAAGISAMLNELDIETSIAPTAATGLAMLRRSRPDAIILDVGLPDLDGAELFLRLREVDPEMPVIVSTGHADQARLGGILDEPMVAHLMKPYDSAALISAFQAVGAGRKGGGRR
jgi:PAS domain S-box-containing protein